MRNELGVDTEDERLFVLGAAAAPPEEEPDDGLIYLEGRPIAFSSERR